MISTHGLGKSFAGVPALKEVDLELGTGMVGLLGRNGAGKSTLLAILAGLVAESTGRLTLHGETMARRRAALRGAVTLLPQDLSLDPRASPRLFVRHLLSIRGLRTDGADRWLGELGLGAVIDRPIATMSTGMQQRVGLAYALATETPVLLLDEPTQGLDPWERLRLADLLANLAGDRLVIFSTHHIVDVEAIAPRVVVLDAGTVRYDGSVDELRARAPRAYLVEGDKHLVDELGTRATVVAVTRLAEDRFRVRVLADEPPRGSKEVEPTLSDAYMSMTAAGAAC